MNIQVGVMGAAGGVITDEELDLARRLGRRIAQAGCTIVTGACPGLPHAAALGTTEEGGVSFGVSPALSPEEHVNVYCSPIEPYTAMVFTGSGLMGRETHNIHSSDFVLFVGGRSGTLGEFCIAYDEGKLIGILLHSGGISDDFERIIAMVRKQTGSHIITDDDPERLVDRCLDYYREHNRPTSVAFNRPRIVQETRG